MDASAAPPVVPPPLPVRKSRWKGILCFVAALIVVAFGVKLFKPSPLAGHQEELRAIASLSALRYPVQMEKARPACTEKGYKLVEYLGHFMPASFNAVSAKSNPQFCDVEMVRDSAEGKARIHVRLAKDNGWKFDDVYLNEIKGKPCNLWASFVRENPLASVALFHSEDALKASKEVVDTTKDVLEIIQLIKRLNEGDRREQIAGQSH